MYQFNYRANTRHCPNHTHTHQQATECSSCTNSTLNLQSRRAPSPRSDYWHVRIRIALFIHTPHGLHRCRRRCRRHRRRRVLSVCETHETIPLCQHTRSRVQPYCRAVVFNNTHIAPFARDVRPTDRPNLRQLFDNNLMHTVRN